MGVAIVELEAGGERAVRPDVPAGGDSGAAGSRSTSPAGAASGGTAATVSGRVSGCVAGGGATPRLIARKGCEISANWFSSNHDAPKSVAAKTSVATSQAPRRGAGGVRGRWPRAAVSAGNSGACGSRTSTLSSATAASCGRRSTIAARAASRRRSTLRCVARSLKFVWPFSGAGGREVATGRRGTSASGSPCVTGGAVSGGADRQAGPSCAPAARIRSRRDCAARNCESIASAASASSSARA